MFRYKDEDVAKEVGEAIGLSEEMTAALDHFAVLDGYANRRVGNLLAKRGGAAVRNQLVVHEGDCSIVCVTAQHDSLKIPVGINRAGKLETCVKRSHGRLEWDESLQDEITKKCEAAMLENSVLGKVGI